MRHAKVLTYCSIATYNGLGFSFFSLQFNNSNTGLFTVYTGMKNISRVHMVDSWNGLKKVSVSQQTSNRGTVPDSYGRNGRGESQLSTKLPVLSSSLCIHPAGELLAEHRVQHDQRDRRGDVAAVHVPDVAGVLQP